MIKGVVFDLDGTLANSIEDIADSMNIVLSEKDFPTHDYDTYKTFVGRGLKALVENALPESGIDEATLEACYNRMMSVYDENCVAKTCLYPGIAELLTELQKRNIKIAVFSNKANELTQKVAKALLADWQLEMVIGAGGDIPRKPNPKGAIMISTKMRIAPEEIMYVGDSGVDMQTAVNSGMYAAGVLWGFRGMEELLENGAEVLVENPMDLLNSLD